MNIDNNFEKIADMARDVVDAVTKKTDELVSTSKLRIKKSNLNSELRDAYQKLGGAVYEAKKHGSNNDDLITLITTEIDEIIAAIRKIDVQLDQINSSLKCTNCGCVNSKEAFYCQNCGTVVPKTNNDSCCCNNSEQPPSQGCGCNVEPDIEEIIIEDISDDE